MQFRPAQMTDASSLAAISLEVWFGTYIRSGVNAFFADFALAEFTAEKFEAILADESEHVIVSQNSDGIDGFLRITTGKPAPVDGCSTVEISTLYVQPRHHGRGIGTGLLAEGDRIGAEHGAASLWLAVNSENTPAIGFYQAQGFHNAGQTHFRIGDEAYPNEILARSLPPLATGSAPTSNDR